MLKRYDLTKDGQRETLYEYIKKRSSEIAPEIYEKAFSIVNGIKEYGDEKLLEYTLEFDKVKLDPDDLIVSDADIKTAYEKADEDMIRIIKSAAANIREYHLMQMPKEYMYKKPGGTVLGQVLRPLDKVGIYIPGGTAPLISSVLMNAIPAKLAGCGQIIMAVPPKAEGLNGYLLVAAKEAGVDVICRMGGAQAVGALAYGTKTIPKVDKITGPGNAYVAAAKKIVFGTCGIDMIAGPSEICVIADSGSNEKFIAADLLSQAEHDADSSVFLIATDENLISRVEEEIKVMLTSLKRSKIAEESLKRNGCAIIANDIEDALMISNEIAPEHLELAIKDADKYVDIVKNAGAVFVGEYTPEAVGDYFAGPNHVLPTSGTARFSSPLGVYDFMKRISYINYSKADLFAQGGDIIRFAEQEGLGAHAGSIKIRLGVDYDR